MRVVVFSSADKSLSEVNDVIRMFENGLECFHLRKPKFRRKELEKYILAIPSEYRDRIILHTHHQLASIYGLKGVHHTRAHRKKKWKRFIEVKFSKISRKKLMYTRSYHSLSDFTNNLKVYDYIFLSPVFDSISKSSHKSSFKKGDITQVLKSSKLKIYALGGINPETAEKAFRMGFDGIAVLGYIWEAKQNPVDAYLKIKDKIKTLEQKMSVAV